MENRRTEAVPKMEDLIPLITERLEAGQEVRFSPRGVSMLPMLRQGRDSVVLARPPRQLKRYDLPLYRRDDGKYVLHRVIQTGEGYTCMGDNQFEAETGIRHDQILGVVTAFYRDERPVAVTSVGYGLYCRFWHRSRGLRRMIRKAKAYLKRMIAK
jgi:hypothetical protein